MNKKVMAIVAVIALVAILGVCLVACNTESVSKKLEKKEYNVAKLNEDSTGLAGKAYAIVKGVDGFKEGLFAAKSSDQVLAVWFDDTDAAKEFEANKGLALLFDKVTRVGKVVYAGTEQGVKDAK